MAIKVGTYREMNARDLDQLIQLHMCKPDFSCIAKWEWNRDTYQKVICSSRPLDAYDYEEIEDFKKSSTSYASFYSPDASQIIRYLIEKGQLPAGNYLIEVG